MDYKDKKMAILGYGVEGQAAYHYLKERGAALTICDQNSSIKTPDGAATRLGPEYLQNLDDFDFVVRSPGVKLSDIKTKSQVITSTQEFFANCLAPIIGVTGTKGKGTTATLIALLLKAAGRTVHLGGNIGQSSLEFLAQVKKDDLVVLELSSYQLEDLEASPHIAVCLMIADDHLEFHGTKQHYVEAKSHIFKYQTGRDVAVYYQENEFSTKIATLSAGQKRPFFDDKWTHIKGNELYLGDKLICKISEVGLLGAHNLQNVAAALNATADYIDDAELIAKVLKDFKGLAHRLELVREVGGVEYINDSYGSVPEATQAAIEAFDQPIVLILGGYNKGKDMSGLVHFIVRNPNVRQVILLGELAPTLQQLFDQAEYQNYQAGFNSMSEVVAAAAKAANSGYVVLLAPGTSSFDMFKNFQERGEQFKQAVNSL